MNCKTDGAVYEIEISRHGYVSCKVFLPPTVTKKSYTDQELRDLKKRMHDGMESALAPLFPQYAALSSTERTCLALHQRLQHRHFRHHTPVLAATLLYTVETK